MQSDMQALVTAGSLVLVLLVSCWALWVHVEGLKKAALPPLHGLVFDVFLA